MTFKQYKRGLKRNWPPALIEFGRDWIRFRHSDEHPTITVQRLDDGGFVEGIAA